jgi:hypothetical protein
VYLEFDIWIIFAHRLGMEVWLNRGEALEKEEIQGRGCEYEGGMVKGAEEEKNIPAPPRPWERIPRF